MSRGCQVERYIHRDTGGREGGRDGGRDGGREGGREREREGWREGREGRREGGREGREIRECVKGEGGGVSREGVCGGGGLT